MQQVCSGHVTHSFVLRYPSSSSVTTQRLLDSDGKLDQVSLARKIWLFFVYNCQVNCMWICCHALHVDMALFLFKLLQALPQDEIDRSAY